ncbi:MAG TPA: heme o synthase [Actinomycetota bacterium]|nr:heme o synthase [Actinomycetota bacterium]
MTRFQKLAIVTTASTLLLVAVGGLVRATGSGLGCPGWPTCFGRWIPPLEYHAIIEYAHRLLASVVVVLVALQALVAWRRLRTRAAIVRPAVAAVGVVLLQAALGGVVVRGGLHTTVVALHFTTAMALLAVVTVVAANAFRFHPGRAPQEADGTDPGFPRLALGTAAAVGALLVVGAYVRAEGAGLAFRDWPLMDGRLVPTLGGAATLMFVHRVLAALVSVLVVWLAVRARTSPARSRDLVALTTTALALFGAQILVGAANVWSELGAPAVTAHVALSGTIWGVLVATATLSRRLVRPTVPAGSAGDRSNGKRGSLRETTAAYVQLTKPRIIELLLITTVPAMVLAERRMPSPWLVLATLLGGALAAGSANAINCYLDRDIDEVMRRTRRRPLPSHRIDPERALAFGYALGAVSFFFLAIAVNVLAASLALSAIAFYVFVYTMWLKRTSVQNIVVGGAAGAVPALVGWAAVTGTVGPPAWVLFAIVFVWTPPHFWALAMRYQGDYAAAGVPMLPVVRGSDETRRQILLYSLVLFATSLLLIPVGRMGAVYAATALVLGSWFVWRALRLWREASPAEPIHLFRFSIVYLGLLFASVAVDAIVPSGTFT